MDNFKNIFSFKKFQVFVVIIISLTSINAISETFQLGDVAPRGAPDGLLNAADALILQKMVLGDIVPDDTEKKIGDVAPLGDVDGTLNTGDLVVQQRAILGEITLGVIEITSLQPPDLNPGVSPTDDNPYTITGTATPDTLVDIYVEGAAQQQVRSNISDGTFSIDVYLFDGINNIYATETDGIDVSPNSNTLQVEYINEIDRDNLPSYISEDTVWTTGASSQPYIITSKLTVSSNAKFIIQPGVTLIFEGKYSHLDVSNGHLIIRGSETNKVILTASNQLPGKGWDGIFVDRNGYVTIDNAIIEYANSRSHVGPIGSYSIEQGGIIFAPGSDGVVSNTILQNNRTAIKLYGNTSPIIASNNEIINNNIGLYLQGEDGGNPEPKVNQNKIFNNSSYNVQVYSISYLANTIDMQRNYWGSINASEITRVVLGTSGPDPVIDYSNYLDINGDVVPVGNVIQGYVSTGTDMILSENTIYEVRGGLEIEAGATLTIPKGASLKFTNNAGLTVYGDLIVQGTQAEPVSFTSGRDSPTYSSWDSIEIKDGGNVNINFAVIEYGSRGIYFREGSDGSVINSVIRNNKEGVHVNASSPTIGPNNTITNNHSYSEAAGIYLSKGTIDPAPIIKNNQIFDNTPNSGTTRNIVTGSFVGGRNITVDVRENYWGSVNASEIANTIINCHSSNSSDPCVDYGAYLDINGNVVGGESLIGVLQDDLVLLAGKTYEVLGYVVIPDSITLTMPSGVTMVFVSLYDNLDVYGNLIVTGTQTNPVIFTSGQVIPKEGARSYPGDWNGIVVNDTGSLTMEYAVIQYPDNGIKFYDEGTGNITNSVIEYAGTGIYFYHSSNVEISNNLFRLNGTALEIVGSSFPIIGPANTIKQNGNGIYLKQLSSQNPAPSINGNYIFNNDVYNINVNNFVGGNSTIVDVQGNYWGTDDPVAIALTMNQSSGLYPTIDFSNFILTEDVPPGTGSSPVAQELQTCPVIPVFDDDFIDAYPADDISWIGNNYTDVQEIEKAFNNARLIDNSIFQYLKMPTQIEWDAMSIQQKGLYLVNSERQARGIKPYEGISQKVVTIAQNYSDYLRTNNLPVGHYQDGKSPVIRLNEDSYISNNSDTGIYLESIYGQSGSTPVGPEAVVDAVYRWIYADKSGGNNWGHRDHIIQTLLNENSGEAYKEGLVGFGISIGDYDPTLSLPDSVGAVVVMNTIDPSSIWDHSSTQSIDTDAAQLCNNRIAIHIDETSVFSVDQITSLEISPSDVYLTPGGSAQLQVIAKYQEPIPPRDITTAASFTADGLSVVNIGAGYITALKNGDVYATATVNGVTSNSIFISVRDKTDTSNLIGAYAEDYLEYVPDNATLDRYDPKAFGLFTGVVKDRSGAPIEDVTISIRNKTEYGSVKTDATGRFIMAAEAGEKTIVYRKPGFLTLHRNVVSTSNAWGNADDVIMLPVDTKETNIDLSITTPQVHTSTIVTDEFGSRSTTLIFSEITSATVTSPDGRQRSLTDFSVRATEYELPQSMPAALPKESAFTYCSELQILTVRDDETITFDNPVVMYVDNFLGFGVGEIVPIGYYDRQAGEWEASDNGVVVKLLDTDSDGLVDGLDFDGDDIADDFNEDGSTTDEAIGIENYAVGSTYWRGSFNHFTPWDFNWPYTPPPDAVDRGDFEAETSNEDKKQDELTCTGSYVKPETRSFHEDIPITGTDLTLHYSSQRTDGYKHKFNVKVSGDTIPDSMLSMLVKLEIGGHVFEETFDPLSNQEAEFIWDGKDLSGKRIKGVARGLISIGYRYQINYSSAGFVAIPIDPERFKPAWAKVGTNIINIPGRPDFISWSTSTIAVQNTYDNQIADGWTISNHHLSSQIGNIYKGDGEVVDTDKSSIVMRTGIKISRYEGDDGSYQKGGKDIDYAINTEGTLTDKVTGLEWQYIEIPEKFREVESADNYCTTASFSSDKEGWRLPTNKEIVYTIDKSDGIQEYPIYKFEALDNIWSTSNNNPENKLLPVICVKGETINTRYVADLKRDDTAEVVIDGQTGLMWQDNASNISITKNWTDAIDYCEGLDHAGYINWRLPNINELAYTLPNSVFINETVFSGTLWGPSHPLRKPYWSSTPNPSVTNQSWAMESVGFSSLVFDNSDSYYVRCVRDNLQAARSQYRFDEYGKHLETIDLDSGKTLTTFGYDAEGRLITITDRFGDVVTIHRDGVSGKALSIRSEDSYVTRLTIATNGTLEDQNNHLTQVTYDDDSNYTFTYLDTKALLTRKTDPNNNIFLHQFDLDGRTKQTSDDEGGIWSFFSSRSGASTAQYGYTTAETNTYQTLRTIEDNGDVNKVTTLFDGTELTNFDRADDLKQTQEACSVTTVIDKVIDNKTKEPIPSQVTITQPSGLQSITQLTKEYGEEDADFTQQTLTVELNGKTSTVFTDTTTGITTTTSANSRTTTLNYDPDTLLLQSSQIPGLFSTTYTYDTRGRQKTITTGARTTTFTYDPVGKGDVTSITADDGKITQFEYDALGRVKTIIYPDTHRTENIYDNNGNLTTLVIPSTANHSTTYNAVNKVKTETTPKDGVITEVTQYDYDKEKNLAQITLPSSKVITNTYTNGLLDFTTTPEGVIDYSYTCNAKVSSITEGAESIIYGYDGSLLEDITYTGALNKIINQAYNNDFNLASLTYAGQTTAFGYDNDGLLTNINTGNAYTITRSGQNGLPIALNNSVLQQTRSYNNYGEATTVNTTINSQSTYNYTLTYNDLGKISEKQETLDTGTVNNYVYNYDDRRRLNAVTKNGTIIENYIYDENGNRTSQTSTARGIINQSASYNLGDQLISNGATTYDYDTDGYLKEKVTAGGTTTYQYSSQGRLLDVITPTKTITYKHNAIGNRVEKKVDGVIVEKYLWLDKTTLLAIYDKDDVLVQRYQYTDGNTPNSFTQAGQTYYIVTDHLGSPRVITDSSGAIIKKLDYDSFGNIISDSAPAFTIPFGFAGGLYDSDTGLVRYGFRDYDADTGRWTARDPIGFAGGDTNLYGYTFNDPINFTDPDGLIACGGFCIAGIATGGYAIYKGYQFFSEAGAAMDRQAERNQKLVDMVNGDNTVNPDTLQSDRMKDAVDTFENATEFEGSIDKFRKIGDLRDAVKAIKQCK